MDDSTNYSDKYQQLITRKDRFRFLSEKIKLFDTDLPSMGTLPRPEPPQTKEQEGHPKPVPQCHRFITAIRPPIFHAQNPPPATIRPSPDRTEVHPTRGNVASIVQRLEKMAISTHRPPPSPSPPSPASPDLSEASASLSHVEDTMTILSQVETEISKPTFSPQEESVSEDFPPEPTEEPINYDKVESKNVIEFKMTRVPEFQRMSTKYDVNDLDDEMLTKFPGIYPSTVELMKDLKETSEMARQNSSVILNTVKSEFELTHADLRKSLHLEENVIHQVFKAMSTFMKGGNFIQTSMHAECSRMLLVATQRKAAIMGAMRQPPPRSRSSFSFRIRLDEVKIQMRRSFPWHTDETHYFVVIVRHGHRVLSSELRASCDFFGHTWIDIPDVFELYNLPLDFTLSLEVYYMTLENQVSSNVVKMLAPLKLLRRKSDKKVVSPRPFTSLPHVSLRPGDNGRRAVQIVGVPGSCPLDGVVKMRYECWIASRTVIRCFLTFREGTGSWDRRWCLFHEAVVRMWHYPDDEGSGKVPLRRLDLTQAMVGEVRVVSCAQCPRPFTLEVRLREGDAVRISLVSADSKEEMENLMEYFQSLCQALRLLNAAV